MLKRDIVTKATASTAIGLTVGAQASAWLAGYRPALGRPLLSDPFPLYAPWDLPWWFLKWRGQTDVFTTGLVTAAIVAGVPLLVHAVKAIREGASPENEAWGSRSDAKAAGILSKTPRGTVLGKIGRRFVSYAGEAHGIIAGASDAGKTVGPAFGTLLTDTGRSVVVYDPKAEMYEGTAAWRNTFSETLFFDPTRTDSVRFNPLAEIPVGGPREIAETQNVAGVLIESSGLSNENPIWPITASELLTGVILHLARAEPKRCNLPHLRELLFDVSGTLEAMEKSDHPECKRVAAALAPMSPKIKDSICVTARGALAVFADPIVAAITSESDFRISDIVCSEIPFSLYLQVRQSDERRLRPLIRLILSQITMTMLYDTRHTSDGREKKWRLLYLIDEFPGLGKIEAFLSEMRQFRGYGITALLIMQSLKDLRATYGQHNSFLDVCHYALVHASADPDSQRDISQMLGEFIDVRASETKPRDWEWRGGSTTKAEQRKPLMDTGKVRTFDNRYALLVMNGLKPLKVRKAPWFMDRLLRQRGTNIRDGQKAPGQNPRVVALRTPSENAATQQTQLDRVRLLISENGWSQREAAQRVFPDYSESRGRNLLTGKTPLKPEDEAQLQNFLSGTHS